MKLDLLNKTALVTGSTAGIGLAVARELAKQRATVWISGRTEQRVNEAVAALKREQPDAAVKGVAADVTTAGGLQQLFAKLPGVDVLVNNVGGVNAFKPFEKLSDEEWLQAFEVNVMTGMRITRQYLPAMRAQNWGRVVFVSSESGVQIPTEFMQYGVAKAAEIGLARGIAETLVGSGVTVNSVLPGPTLSEALTKAIAASGRSTEEFEKDMMEKRRTTSLLRRFTTVEEVASMVAYVCSPSASGTHGAALRVEGGIIKSAF
jgi:NAD(P)-dependent dehydrogenase (short-subunit alcohol dehydrogenase family)